MENVLTLRTRRQNIVRKNMFKRVNLAIKKTVVLSFGAYVIWHLTFGLGKETFTDVIEYTYQK